MKLDIDSVEDVLDEARELHEDMETVAERLAMPIGSLGIDDVRWKLNSMLTCRLTDSNIRMNSKQSLTSWKLNNLKLKQ